MALFCGDLSFESIMPGDFDPYYKWLGVPPAEQPPDHYRLLGIPRFEPNPDVISNAADARMAYIRTFQSGPNGAHSQRILNELSVARTTLLNEARKANYDQGLKASLAALEAGAAVIPMAEPQPDLQQQQALLALQRQLETVKAREAHLAQQQAQYAAALAQAEATRQAQAQPETFVAVATKPAIAVGQQPRKKPSSHGSIPLPLLVGGIAAPVLLLALVVGYLVTRGGKEEPVVVTPTPPVVTPSKPPVPKGNTTPEGNGTPTPAVVTPVTSTPEVSGNKPRDLLALLETPRDVRSHGGDKTTKEDNVLKLRHASNFTCALVPEELPDNYRIDLRVTPRKGEGLSFGFHIGGKNCMLDVDGFGTDAKGTQTVLEMIDNRRPNHEGFTGKPHLGKLLKQDVESQLSIRVVGNSLEFSCDGKRVLRWTGDPARLGVFPWFDQKKPKGFWVGCWASEYDVSSIVLQSLDKAPPSSTPPSGTASSKPAPGTIDLFSLVQLPRDLRSGEAEKTGSALQLLKSSKGGFSCVGLPLQLPPNYQLELEVTPRNAPDSFLVGVSVAGRPCLVSFDGYRTPEGEMRTSLEVIDGRRPFEAGFKGPIYKGQLLKNDVAARVSVRVIGNSLQVVCNGQEVLLWNGDPQQLSIHPMFGKHPDRGAFVGSWASQYDVSSITLRPLPGPAITVAGTPRPRPSPRAGSYTSPWRWARYRGDITSFALSPKKDRAVFLAPRASGENVLLADMATGDLVKRTMVTDPGVEDSGSLRLGPAPDYTFAYPLNSDGKIGWQLIMLTPQSQTVGLSFNTLKPDSRLAFSSQMNAWAYSGGRGNARVTLQGDSFDGNIDPPAGLANPFVHRMLDDGDYLLIEYTGQKMEETGMVDVHRIVSYDWQSRSVKQTTDLTPKEAAGVQGMVDATAKKLNDSGLYLWGRQANAGARGWFKFSDGGGVQYGEAENSSPTVTVIDALPSRQLLLLHDPQTTTLEVRHWHLDNDKTCKMVYSTPIDGAAFVDEGRGVLVMPRSTDEPILVWDVDRMNESSTIPAPKCSDLRLPARPGQNRADQAALPTASWPLATRVSSSAKPTTSSPTSPKPAPSSTQDAVWRWARHPGDAKELVLSPSGDAALLAPARSDTAVFQLIDPVTGRRLASLPMTSLESSESLALDDGPSHFLAGTSLVNKQRTFWLTALTPRQGAANSDQAANVKQAEVRIGFSGQGLLAHSGGRGNASVAVRNCRTFTATGLIEAPKGLTGVFVERIYNDDNELAVVYSGRVNPGKTGKAAKKAGGAAKLLTVVCYYDWISHKPTRRFELPGGPTYHWLGMRLESGELWAWGRTPEDGAVLSIFTQGTPGGRVVHKDSSSPDLHVVDAVPGRRQLLKLDAKLSRVTMTELTSSREAQWEFANGVKDARFVEQGKSILCFPSSSLDPLLQCDASALVRTKALHKAPTCAELGLTSADADDPVRPGQSPAPSGNGEAPSR